jgi:hypothetical protein
VAQYISKDPNGQQAGVRAGFETGRHEVCGCTDALGRGTNVAQLDYVVSSSLSLASWTFVALEPFFCSLADRLWPARQFFGMGPGRVQAGAFGSDWAV